MISIEAEVMSKLLLFTVLSSYCLVASGINTDVECSTTAGDFTIRLSSEWSPMGVKRFLQLVDKEFFDDQLLYRVIPGFLVQFGVAAKPEVMRKWNNKRIPDEPKTQNFKHGTVSFAGAGEDSRSCHIFIAFKPHGENLGQAPHETPLGQVVAGLDVLDTIQQNYGLAGYQDLSFLQGQIGSRGNIAAKDYPKLDRIKTCRKVEASATDGKRAQEDAKKATEDALPLPAGWTVSTDPETGIEYYLNSATGTRQFKRPKAQAQEDL
eukprot:gnl/MRDRNA2_/MRDRNA2_78305_c0_seq1.p1 gnl/MRDRNA2_/MRDRNA2_78305_c0~~gnl/MRDRNA2_/MRDRNA2_78305_c0_seq1.p1  ORF type:complete len:265 (+),score=65.68 gnl/MRDRNA2_/MRDRNA2_78305_c0_seq1:66-860(+)